MVGEPVTIAFSVTVDAPGAGSPTGTVTVTDADSLQTCSATVAAGSCQIAFSAAGSHNLTATYGGDADFNGSASSPATVHVVDKADTTTTITSDDDDPSVVGQTYTVTWTVSVDAPGAGSPSGTVTVGDGDGNSCAAPVGDGTCDLASTSAGAKTLTATYAGDGNFNGPLDTEAHQVDKADTTTTITSDLPDPTFVDQIYTVTWTVTVNAPGAGIPTGTVTVSDGTGSFCTVPVATGSCGLASTSAGAKTLTATYSGDDDFNGSLDTEAHLVNPRTTTTEVVCVPDSIVVDQETDCTVTVTDVAGLGSKSDPSGTVTFTSNQPGTFDSTTCALSGNGDFTSSCLVTYTPTAKGTGLHVIGASYGGSTVHATSSDIDGVEVTVDHRTTATSVVCASPVVVGQGSLCTAQVDDTAGAGAASAPAGTVDFLGEGPGAFDSTSCSLLVLDADSSSCSVTYTPTAVGDGVHTIDAAYTHSGDIHSDSDDDVDITVDKADTTTTITSDDDDPSVVGQTYTVTWTVSVDAPGAGSPSGTVTVGDGDGNSCAAPVGDGTCDLASTSAGAKTLTATYAGDSDFNGSLDTEAHQVDKADTTTTITSDLPDPSVVGEPVTIAFSVTVDAPGAGSPTGTVTVTDADSLQTCSATVAAGSCQIAFSAAGSHNLTATYGGDADFNGSASSPATVHVVDKADTTTTITSDDDDPSVVGQTYTVTWTVSVDAPGAGSPSGTVTVGDGDGNSCAAPVGDGTCDLASTSAGAKTLTATYAGDSDFNGSLDTEAHQVDKADTTTTITSDLPDPSVVGEPVTIAFSVTVDAPGAGSPTGTVTVTDADSLQTCSATVAAGSCQIAFSAAGSHNLTATYGGDADFNGSASSPATVHVVDKADTTTTITSDDDDPSVVGQTYTVTWTVSVDAPGAGSPSGTVTVGDGDGNSCAAPVGDGTCDLASTSAGAKTLTATYAGDADFDGSASTPRHDRRPNAAHRRASSASAP